MITLYARTRASSLVDMATHDPPARLAQAAYHIRFVVQKFVWPSGLSPLYQRPDVVDPWSSPFFSSLLLVSVAGLLLVLVRKHRPGLFTAGLAFVLLLSPVAGAVQSGPQLTADRYAYVPSMALLAALVLWGENRRKAIAAVVRPRLVVALATALLTAATMKTHRQIRVWSHSAELWLRVVEVDPGSYVGRHALGTVLDSLGRRDLAEEQYRRALSLQPTFTPSILALARVHRAAGRLRRAEALESLASRLQSAGPSTRRIEAATP
jgi:tetratricopeptide (TPR) repeat protein